VCTYAGMVHGFFSMGGVLDAAVAAHAKAAHWLRQRITSPGSGSARLDRASPERNANRPAGEAGGPDPPQRPGRAPPAADRRR
jgi:hypothetical protein